MRGPIRQGRVGGVFPDNVFLFIHQRISQGRTKLPREAPCLPMWIRACTTSLVPHIH